MLYLLKLTYHLETEAQKHISKKEIVCSLVDYNKCLEVPYVG